MKKEFKRWLLYTLLIALVLSCSDNNEEKPDTDNLVKAELVGSRSAGDIQFAILLSGRDIDETLFQYDVDIYKVIYKTTFKEAEINASGLIILPKGSGPTGIVSFQHGTIVQQTAAPTAQSLNNFEILSYCALASLGFITVVPDFVGFGESKEIFHPYYIEEPTASAVIDNIIAAKTLSAEKQLTFNSKLFLAGYSQGGYATMAAHKAIESQDIEGMELIASFPAAGGYDIEAMQDYFFSLDQYSQPYYLAFAGRSYQNYYAYDNLLTDFFNEPYASRIPTLFDGNNGPGTINSQLSGNISELVREDLRLNFNTDSKYAYIRDSFSENSLTDWTPTITMFMYHGDADITVPYENSEITYQQLLANGASTDVIKLIPLLGADHSSGVDPYIDDLIKKLLKLK